MTGIVLNSLYQGKYRRMKIEQGQLRAEFPIFSGERPFFYLDNASSSQKPRTVIERVKAFYEQQYANVHRGLYRLSEEATLAYEDARRATADFIGAKKPEEVVFVRGTTEGINLVASSWCQENLRSGDEILLTMIEHHANIVPWQLAASRVGAKVKFIPLREDLHLDVDEARRLITDRTKVFAMTHVSNVLGSVQPVAELIDMAKSVGAMTLIDGAQAVPHFDLDMQSLGCDFYFRWP